MRSPGLRETFSQMRQQLSFLKRPIIDVALLLDWRLLATTTAFSTTVSETAGEAETDLEDDLAVDVEAGVET
jgi:hypothetical protein